MSMPIEGRVVRQELNTHYRIVKVDLSEARDHFEGQKIEGPYRELRVLAAPAAFSMKFNSQAYPEIPIAANTTPPFSDLELNELFIKNDAGTGTAVLWLAGFAEE